MVIIQAGILLIFFLLERCSPREYAIVIDGGTSSSKFHVFSYDDIRRINQLHYFKVYPGIWNFPHQLEEVTLRYIDALEECLEYIPKDKVHLTPVYLGGTSGLRMLKSEDRDRLMYHVRNLIKERYNFRFKDRFVRVLSGSEEATFAWISIQILLENDFSEGNIVGALDMGSGSNQIAFKPDEDILDAKLFVNALNRIVPIYGNSFQMFGQDSSFNMSLEILQEHHPISYFIDHPCLQEGFSYYEPRLGAHFNGTSNVTACKELVKIVLNRGMVDSGFCSFESCTVQNKYIPKINETKKFIAMSGYWYMAEGIVLENRELPITLRRLLEAGSELCSQNRSTFLELTNYGIPEENFMQCYFLFHDLFLLSEKHHFDLDSTQIQFSKKVNDKKVSWTPGLLFYEVESMTYLTSLFPEPAANLVLYESLSYLFIVLFSVSFFVLLVLVTLIGIRALTFFLKKRFLKKNRLLVGRARNESSELVEEEEGELLEMEEK